MDKVRRDLEGKLRMSVADLDLPVRVRNCLEFFGVLTVRELVSHTVAELMSGSRGVGETTIREATAALARHGLLLGMQLDPLEPHG